MGYASLGSEGGTLHGLSIVHFSAYSDTIAKNQLQQCPVEADPTTVEIAIFSATVLLIFVVCRSDTI